MTVSTTLIQQGLFWPGYIWVSNQTPVKFDRASRQWVGTTWDEQVALRNHAREAYASSRVANIPWTGILHPEWLGSYLVSLSGPVPTQEYVLDPPDLKTSNVPYNTKVQEGKIVVSDFRTFKVQVAATPELRIDTSTDEGIHGVYLYNTAIFPVIDDPVGQFSECFTFNGSIYSGGFLALSITRVSGSYGEFPSDYSASLHAEKIYLNFLREEMVSSHISDCLGKATTGAFDALTALAESVETCSSTLNYCITVLKMYRDAKKGEVRLYNKLSRLEKIERPSAQTRKEIKEITSAIASLWLSYRLSIKPFVSMIEDMLQLDLSSERIYLRYRDGGDQKMDVSFGSERTSVSIKHRVFIKRLYESWLSSLGVSPIRTIIELVPLSFVVERYMTIGNALSSLSPNLSIDEGATYSWKCSDKASGTYNGVQYSVDISAYRRQVINPSHYCGIGYPESRTLNQTLDHIALVWSLFLKDFLYSKKGKS